MFKSKADIKRQLTEGTDVYLVAVVGDKVVHKEHRVVSIAQTNAVAFDTPDKDEPVWLYFNNDFGFHGEYFSLQTLGGSEYRYYLDESKWKEL